MASRRKTADRRDASQHRGMAASQALTERKSVSWYAIDKKLGERSKLPEEVCLQLESAFLDGKSTAFFTYQKTGLKYTAFLGRENKVFVDTKPSVELERVEESHIVELEKKADRTENRAPDSTQLPHTPDEHESHPNTMVSQTSTSVDDFIDDVTKQLGGMNLMDQSCAEHETALASKAPLNKNIAPLKKGTSQSKDQPQCTQAQSSSTNFPPCSEKNENVLFQMQFSAPTIAESKTDSNKPTSVQDQSSGPQSERKKLPIIPKLQPTGPNAVTVSSQVIPVGNTSVSFSSLGARPKKIKTLEVGKEQQGNGAMSAEELWQKMPAWKKKDDMICYGKTICVLFPSNDVDEDESIFFQSLFLGQCSWSKCFLEYLQKKQFSISKENVRTSGKFVQHIIVSSKTEYKNVDKYQMLYELVQECGIRVRLFNKNSSESEHILQEPLPALVTNGSVNIFRNLQGDKLILIGREQDLKEIMKVYGLESIDGKGYIYGESLEMSSLEALLFTNLNLSKFLQFDKYNVKCHVSKGIQKPTLTFVGMSLKQIREASESTTRFLEKVPCVKFCLQKEKMNLLQQIETKIYVEERLKQKRTSCVICVADEAVKIFSVMENQIMNAKLEIEKCINTHILPSITIKNYLNST